MEGEVLKAINALQEKNSFSTEKQIQKGFPKEFNVRDALAHAQRFGAVVAEDSDNGIVWYPAYEHFWICF